MVDPSVAIFGPLDAVLADYAGYLVFAFAILTFLTRKLQQNHVERRAEEADDDDADVGRYWLHSATMGAFVLSSFYYLTLHHHSGIVVSTLAVGTFIADFFEAEARNLEVREDLPIEAPKGATVVAFFAFLYAAYIAVFPFIKDYWNLVV